MSIQSGGRRWSEETIFDFFFDFLIFGSVEILLIILFAGGRQAPGTEMWEGGRITCAPIKGEDFYGSKTL